MLQQFGYGTVDEANTSRDAVKFLQAYVYDLVFMGTDTTEFDSLALVRGMRGQPEHRRTPVIIVTEKDQPEDVLEAMEAGATDYMLKPLDRDVIQRKIARALAR